LKRSSEIMDPCPGRAVFLLFGLLAENHDRGYYEGMVKEAARTVLRGIGVNANPKTEPVQGTLER